MTVEIRVTDTRLPGIYAGTTLEFYRKHPNQVEDCIRELDSFITNEEKRKRWGVKYEPN